ncbi:MAG: sodium:alanine symporter family protein [Bacteroidales bacterium]|nr:sodium:alanine symporter family protein [Anaerotignum sp.]MCI5679186.1 sodium:alanine symporter family protein [Bacteroidales bacterium]MDY3926960.1 sodium:alanine symporter family protein [Anaerotignum sp.]
MEAFNNFVSAINGVVWGPIMLVLLIGTHVLLTIRTKGIQRKTFTGIKLSITPDKEASGDIGGFAALATALAATIGTGNIVGVATAVGTGGPGAVFWMWFTGLLGMATKFGEATLAVKYRVKAADGSYIGGPMYALERGLGQKWLGVLFALFTGIACFGIGNMTQGNSIAESVQGTFGVPKVVTGVVLMVLTGLVILGGVKSISKVCEKLIPLMAGLYIVGCVIILVINGAYVPAAFATIIKGAFNPQAVGGGFVGATIVMCIRAGVSRGLFTNESGLGSAPIVDACAATRNPSRQALISMSGVFWDTIVVCLLTGLVLVSSILKDPVGMDGLVGAKLTAGAFNAIPVIGPAVLTFGLITFAWSTILGWSYYGERAWVYLVGVKAIKPYRIAWTVVVLIGCVAALDVVWNVADTLNACMAFPNMVALIGLSGVIASETKKYVWDKDAEMGGLMKWMDDEAPQLNK